MRLKTANKFNLICLFITLGTILVCSFGLLCDFPCVWTQILFFLITVLSCIFVGIATAVYKERKYAIDAVSKSYTRSKFERDAEKIKKSNKIRSFILFAIDLNNFKGVNDSHGHCAGDCVLRGITAILNEINENAIVYRMGGDEFAVLLELNHFDEKIDLNEYHKLMDLKTPSNISLILDDKTVIVEKVCFTYAVKSETGRNCDLMKLWTEADIEERIAKRCQKETST